MHDGEIREMSEEKWFWKSVFLMIILEQSNFHTYVNFLLEIICSNVLSEWRK